MNHPKRIENTHKILTNSDAVQINSVEYNKTNHSHGSISGSGHNTRLITLD